MLLMTQQIAKTCNKSLFEKLRKLYKLSHDGKKVHDAYKSFSICDGKLGEKCQ